MSVSKLYCNIIGKDCIKEDCMQYHKYECKLYKRMGNFLYHSASPIDWAAFIRYVEEIRPEVRREINEEEM